MRPGPRDVMPGRPRVARGDGMNLSERLGKPVTMTSPTGIGNGAIDGKTGLDVPERNPGELAKAIVRLGRHPQERLELGAEGMRLAGRFDARLHTERVMGICRSALART